MYFSPLPAAWYVGLCSLEFRLDESQFDEFPVHEKQPRGIQTLILVTFQRMRTARMHICNCWAAMNEVNVLDQDQRMTVF